MDEYVLEMRNITKCFPGIIANDDITFRLKKQEVHALLGENGAGKSTLMSVLFGMYQPEQGEIYINGEKAEILNPNDANRYRIGMVHQHFKLVAPFTGLQNIVLGVESTHCGFLKMDDARKKVEELIERYGLSVDLDMRVADMTVGMQQRVEILKMLYKDNDILILDEPTAVLTPQEIAELMDIIRNLVKEGKSVVFISHKMSEVMEISDTCTVLRRGENIGSIATADTTREELSAMMVGRQLSALREKEETHLGEAALKLEKLCVWDHRTKKNVVKDVSFEVRAGEIVCIAGIDGNGQTQLVHAITGLCKTSSGKILLDGEDVTKASIRHRSVKGMTHIPEDRHKHGAVMDYSLEENLILQNYFTKGMSKAGIINFAATSTYADDLIEKFDIRSGKGKETRFRSMSGGNQQKAVVAREIERDLKLLVAVQPTRGLDIGAIEFIHGQIIEQRNAGKAVLLVSLELEEVMNISDRILVIYEGEIVGELNPRETNFQELGLYMSGAKRSTVQ